ncbi:myo-inositol 2-dehydrogenase-like isoform X2 [Cynocephalus volans]|uniref:myo-inositol 2-dehydrogenase-like isoform X2 n=1 Tax=Cynocephalus volans TaxID=110931 RepID=UPI002FC9D319
MGRKKKTLQDYAAEFTDLVVKQRLVEHGDSGDTSVVETLCCRACELPMRVRRDRILEHLSSGRHYRNRRLVRQHGARTPVLLSAASDLAVAGLPVHLGHSSLLPQPPRLLAGDPSITSTCMVPPPPAGHTSLLPVPLTAVSSTTSDASAQEDQMPSTSTSHLSAFPAILMKRPSVLSRQTNHRLVSEGSSSAVSRGGVRWLNKSGAGASSRLGLAVFGVGYGSAALLQSLTEENSCFLLYVVEDQLCEVQRAFRAEHLAHTRVIREQDADIVLNDQRVSGVVVCSPPEAASEIVIDALRAGKGVFCERPPSLDRQTAEACFDEAERCGKPLVCGFYKRFDPAFQFLYRQVREEHALGRIHRIAAVSRLYPAASPAFLKRAGGIFYNAAVHDVDVISMLLGESAPDAVFALGHAFCSDMASLEEADTVVISMKFPGGALVSLDVSQHCTDSCDQRLEVRGSQGTLRMENQNSLGITGHGPSLSLCPQTQAGRYQDAYRELFRHFVRTLKGTEPPQVTKEQLLRAIQVAATAAQSWRSRAAVNLPSEVAEASVVKTEAP